MDLGEAIQTDYELIDGIEYVSVYDESTAATDTNVAAKRSQLSYRELAFGGGAGYDATDVMWRLWADTIAFDPRPGDTITDSSSEVWSVQSVASGRVGGTIITYRCVCKQRGEP